MITTYDFSPGPAHLPPVITQLMSEAYLGITQHPQRRSLGSLGHRDPWFKANVLEPALANLRLLLDVPSNFQILLFDGGASTQYFAVALNLLRTGQQAYLANSGWFGAKSHEDAASTIRLLGGNPIIAQRDEGMPHRMPELNNVHLPSNVGYALLVTNETIQGSRLPEIPTFDVPVVLDMTSDIVIRPIPWDRTGIVFASAQKCLGQVGVTVIIVRDDLMELSRTSSAPPPLNYWRQGQEQSLYHTAPVPSIYCLCLCTQWLLTKGVENIRRSAQESAVLLYAAIDKHPNTYTGLVHPPDRSHTNITWKLSSPDVDAHFIQEAEEQGIYNISGFRGRHVRASIYTFHELQAAQALADFMNHFAEYD